MGKEIVMADFNGDSGGMFERKKYAIYNVKHTI
jgi:hypothetical protein